MRFIENGPAIPSHLLEQQAQGNVIFLCGAGVSTPAGLDDFWSLTNRIIEALDARNASELLSGRQNAARLSAAITAAFPDAQMDIENLKDVLSDELGGSAAFDQIFYTLVEDFGREKIDRHIYEALGTQKPRTLANHRNILKLSRSATGAPQVVTTNFDRLFEKAAKGVTPIIPPGLPDLDFRQSIEGVVYLHGRLVLPTEPQLPQYIISSADFGRAYLAEGWAARFVRRLRETYTLVILGYSANDPPMRYLLEGLKNRDGIAYANPIYAFAPDNDDSGFKVWAQRGVTPIAYDPAQKHRALWQTLDNWAKAATDLEQWEQSVVRLAQKRPSELRPFERGQIVELVSRPTGANAFANADPSICAEWLCVLDPYARYGKPGRASWEDDAAEIDPLAIYGLDDDPPRPDPDEQRRLPEGIRNPLAWRLGDGDQSERLTLLGIDKIYQNPLPARLHHLARWFGKVCHEPAAVWWAAGWQHLNPHLHWFVSNRLRDRNGDEMPLPALQFWSFYLEAAEATSPGDREYRWFEFEGMTKRAGWTPPTLRFFEQCLRPYVTSKRPLLYKPVPPAGDWSDRGLRDAADLSVRVLDRHNSQLLIPAGSLPDVVRFVRLSLAKMVELLIETENRFWTAPELHPSGERGETHHGRKEQFVLWFSELFKQFVGQDSAAAKSELLSWPPKEEVVFPKLRLWAAALPDFLTGKEAFEIIESSPEEALWNSTNRRELLHLLRANWAKFTATQRRSIERLLQRGPKSREDETDPDFRKRRAGTVASLLGWLDQNGCELSEQAKRSYEKFRLVDLRWNEEWAKSADESMGPRGGFVAEDTDTKGIEHYPVSDIVSEAQKRTKEWFRELRHDRPFRGLVEEFPFKAISALRSAMKRGEFPLAYWQDLLAHWPADTSIRLRLLVAHSVAGLTPERALELRYYAPDWLEKHLRSFYLNNRGEGLTIFDAFLAPFMGAAPEFTRSGIGSPISNGKVQERSEVSVSKTINSPIGKLTDALWTLTRRKAAKVGKLNGNLAARFSALAEVPGDGAGHTITALTMRIGWIEYCYPDWFKSFILPKFDLGHPLSEAAWHGLAYNRNPLSAELFEKLREPWLTILRGQAPWALGSEERRVLIDALIWLSDPTREHGATFSFAEVREVLRDIDDRGRGQALWALSSVLEKHRNWRGFVKPFIERAWPQQLRYQSEEATRGFLHIAEKAEADFPDAVATVLPLLLPIPHGDMLTYRISRDRGDKENIAREHPKSALQLLDAITSDDRVNIPYDLKGALEVLGDLDPKVRELVEFKRLRALTD